MRGVRQNATAVAAIVSALAAAGALIFSAEQSRGTQQQLLIAEQGQFTDRYTRAVQQLGDPTLDVRLGGIYGLARLARDSPPDQPSIVVVLSAYLRDHARPRTGPCARPLGGAAERAAYTHLPPPVDVKGVIDVLGHRDRTADGGATETLAGACLRYQLADADFTGADLNGADLAGADLTDAHLARADLTDADLTSADLTRTDLTDAHLASAHLARTELAQAELAHAELLAADLNDAFAVYADFTGADLTGANISGANISGANLTSAALSSADLTDADLSGADLTGADLFQVQGLPLGIRPPR